MFACLDAEPGRVTRCDRYSSDAAIEFDRSAASPSYDIDYFIFGIIIYTLTFFLPWSGTGLPCVLFGTGTGLDGTALLERI